MSTLVKLLKKEETLKPKRRKSKILENENKPFTPVQPENNSYETTIGTLTPEEYQQVKESVREIDKSGKSRRDIIIGMFGHIKHPTTGERFSIPNLTWDDEDYAFKYADFMKTLVFKPDMFAKIMNWE